MDRMVKKSKRNHKIGWNLHIWDNVVLEQPLGTQCLGIALGTTKV